jgi:hypothetical protein
LFSFLRTKQHLGTHITCPTQHKEDLLLCYTVPQKNILLVLFRMCIERSRIISQAYVESPLVSCNFSQSKNFLSWLVYSIWNWLSFSYCLTHKTLFVSIFPMASSLRFNFLMHESWKDNSNSTCFLVSKIGRDNLLVFRKRCLRLRNLFPPLLLTYFILETQILKWVKVQGNIR